MATERLGRFHLEVPEVPSWEVVGGPGSEVDCGSLAEEDHGHSWQVVVEK